MTRVEGAGLLPRCAKVRPRDCCLDVYLTGCVTAGRFPRWWRSAQKERQKMPKFMVLVRCDGKDVSRRGFLNEDVARAYAHAVESLGDCEPDGPQFDASVVAL